MIHSFFEECVPPKTTKQQQGYRRYATPKVNYSKAFLTAVMEKNKPIRPLRGAIKGKIIFTWPHTKQTEAQAEKLGLVILPKTTRPDCDNLSKLPWDVMTKVGFYADDNLIYSATVEKYHGPIPGIVVELEDFFD